MSERYFADKNIRVVTEVDPPLDFLFELSKGGDWWARKILKENGHGDFINGYDDGEVREPRNEY